MEGIMNRNILISIVVIGMIFISSCGPSQEAIDQAVRQTLTAMPTQTQIPTQTSFPTKTLTPTVTLTRTPLYTPTSTNTKTPTLASSQKTSTAIAAEKTKIAEYNPIHYKELRDYPNRHVGEKVVIKNGRVMQIIGGRDMLIYFGGTYDLFYVSFISAYSGVYEKQQITIYGTVEGNYCYDTTSGGKNCVPKIYNAFYVK